MNTRTDSEIIFEHFDELKARHNKPEVRNELTKREIQRIYHRTVTTT